LGVPVRLPGSRGVFDIPEEVARSGMTTLKPIETSWFPYYADNLPLRLELIKQESKINKAKQEKLMKKEKDRFVSVKEVNVGSVVTILNPENDVFKFASSLEERFGKGLEAGIHNKKSLAFDSKLPHYAEVRGMLLAAMIKYWEVDIKTAEASAPTNCDVILLSGSEKGFSFGDQYRFIVCLGDPIIIRKDLKGKDFGMPEGSMFIMKNFYSSAFMNFSKFAPIKDEANFKLKSYNSTMVLGFWIQG
jgi:hypothetical protein